MRFKNFSLCMSEPWLRIVAAANIRIPDLGIVKAPILLNSSSIAGTKLTGRSRPYHSAGQLAIPQPESASFKRHSTKSRLGLQFSLNHSRTSLRTCSSFIDINNSPY